MRNTLLLTVLALLVLSIGLVSVAAATPPRARPEDAYNLLTNPGLELYDAPYKTWHGMNAQVPTGWQRFWHDDPEPAWVDGRVYDKGPFGCNCWVEHIEGQTALFLVSYNPYQAGILQHMTGLTPGVGYGFHGVLLTIHEAAGTPPAPDRMFKQIGVDPTGATDPLAPTVIWTTPNGQDKAWDLQQRVSFFAQGPEATVFMRVISLDPADPRQLGILDSTILAETPVVTAVSPVMVTQPTFTVSWDNVQFAPGFREFEGCDVQWMDEADGAWHGWLTQTLQTQADFAGHWGHTYRFRARAWQRYQNNAWLYSPYRDQGDSKTHVLGGSITGQVLSPDGWPSPGAIVAVARTPFTTTTRADGRYTLWVDPLPGGQSVTVSHPYWSSPSPAFGVEVEPGESEAVDWALRSPQDALVNGEFEDGLSGWSVLSDAGVTPGVVGDPVHTGHAAALLGGAAPVAHTTGISQTLRLLSAWEPGLAFWYEPHKGNGGDRFIIVATLIEEGGGEPVTTTLVFTPSLDLVGWGHAWYPLVGAGEYFSGHVTIAFLVYDDGGSGSVVYVDESSLGPMPGGPWRIYFPLLSRRHRHAFTVPRNVLE